MLSEEGMEGMLFAFRRMQITWVCKHVCVWCVYVCKHVCGVSEMMTGN